MTGPPIARLAIPFVISIATLMIAAGCGEKAEPDPSTLGPAPQDATGFEIEGTWQGRLRQKGIKPFRVTAMIGSLDEARDNSVTYTGIDCSGTWKFLDRPGDAYRFREVIDRGAGGSCKGVGTVTLTPTPEGQLDYEFRGGGVTSHGVLIKSG
jgi:hypothetical protein